MKKGIRTLVSTDSRSMLLFHSIQSQQGPCRPIRCLALLPTANSTHGIPLKRHPFSMQSAELNFMVRSFQSMKGLCL